MKTEASAEQRTPSRRFRFSFRSLRFRLTLLYVLVFAATLSIFGLFLYRNIVNSEQTEFDATLFNLGIDVAEGIQLDLFGDLSLTSDTLLERGKILPFSLGKALLQISSPNGNVLVRSRALGRAHLPLDREEVRLLNKGHTSLRTVSADDVFPNGNGKPTPGPDERTHYRLLTSKIDRPPLYSLVFQIAVPMTFIENQRRELAAFLLIALPLVLLIAAIVGWFMAYRALRPVAAITDKTRALNASQLSERVPVPSGNDELRDLALTLNDLLTRLEQAFRSQERFVADASHQLKTPLAILRGELDLIRSGQRSSSEIQDFLQSAAQETEYLSRMVEDLLLLARVDAGQGSLTLSRARMDEIVIEAVSRLERFAKERDIRLRLNIEIGADAAPEVAVDPDLISGLLQNLVENAIKYSPAGETVEISLRERAGESAAQDELEVCVSDHGPGIASEKLAHIFERFYRVESSGKSVPGVGLGLAIAKRIADVHGATLEVRSEAGEGAHFGLRIKKISPDFNGVLSSSR